MTFPARSSLLTAALPATLILALVLAAAPAAGQDEAEGPAIKNPYYETRRVFIKDGWKLHHLPDTGGWRLFRVTDDYERGDSLVETEPERFAEIKAAYELFLARDFKPKAPVKVTKKK